jgi:hypothetical protein
MKTLTNLRPDEVCAVDEKLAEVEAKLDTTPKKRGRKPKQKTAITIDSIRNRKTEVQSELEPA